MTTAAAIFASCVVVLVLVAQLYLARRRVAALSAHVSFLRTKNDRLQAARDDFEAAVVEACAERDEARAQLTDFIAGDFELKGVDATAPVDMTSPICDHCLGPTIETCPACARKGDTRCRCVESPCKDDHERLYACGRYVEEGVAA